MLSSAHIFYLFGFLTTLSTDAFKVGASKKSPKKTQVAAAVLSTMGVAAVTNLNNPVSVVLYSEAECPDCRHFSDDGVVKLIENFPDTNLVDFQYVPYGNAYFKTPECGSGPFSGTEYECWTKMCKSSSSDSPQSCFSTPISVYQHAPPHYPTPINREGLLMLAQSCADKMQSQDDIENRRALQLYTCLEGTVQDIMAKKSVLKTVELCGDMLKDKDVKIFELAQKVNGVNCLKNWTKFNVNKNTSSEDDEVKDSFLEFYRQHEEENARKTIKHNGVPCVTVDGEVVVDGEGDGGDKMIKKICEKLGSRGKGIEICEKDYIMYG